MDRGRIAYIRKCYDKEKRIALQVSEKIQLKMLNYQADAIATSIIRLLTLWVEDQMPFSAKEMAGVSDKMIKQLEEEVLILN